MKNFVDYNPTEEEIIKLFETEDNYKFVLGRFAQHPNGDHEKMKIASLLFLRGEDDESLKMINSIKNGEYRQTCLQTYASWFAEDGEIIN